MRVELRYHETAPDDWYCAVFLRDVKRDFNEMRRQYPYAELRMPPASPPRAEIDVVAASAQLIGDLRGTKEDFLGEYSKELTVIARPGYQETGCDVYGAAWIDPNVLDKRDWHFYNRGRVTKQGYKLCVGVPESFVRMENVVLESVRTADNMLVAYARVMRGESRRLELTAYPHGFDGIRAYRQDRRRYQTKEGQRDG